MKIHYSNKFAKAYKKLPEEVKDIAEKKEEIFREDPFDSRLKTHKLKGELSNFYSFSVSYHWRVVFHFEDEETIVFDAVGTHAVYR